jgi:hypothetical protein
MRLSVSTLRGTLTAFEWQNPHGYFHMDMNVKDSTGSVTAWTLETLSLHKNKKEAL